MLRFDRVRAFLCDQFPTRISKFLNSLNFELLTVHFCMRHTIIFKFIFKKLDKNNPRGFSIGGDPPPPPLWHLTFEYAVAIRVKQKDISQKCNIKCSGLEFK